MQVLQLAPSLVKIFEVFSVYDLRVPIVRDMKTFGLLFPMRVVVRLHVVERAFLFFADASPKIIGGGPVRLRKKNPMIGVGPQFEFLRTQQGSQQ